MRRGRKLPVWNSATSTRDNCLGQECPDYKECFVMRRAEAMAADLVVVNHHLFFADVMLRDEGMAELLPACNTVIFDEAHQLPEVATLFFGDSVSTAQVVDLARRHPPRPDQRPRLPRYPERRQGMEKAARDLRLAVGVDAGRFSYEQLQERPEFAPALKALEDEVAAFAAMLETQAQRAEGSRNAGSARRTAAGVRPVAEPGRSRLRALGRGFHPVAAA
jgi:ATP-dependent DNA helicase DinG